MNFIEAYSYLLELDHSKFTRTNFLHKTQLIKFYMQKNKNSKAQAYRHWDKEEHLFMTERQGKGVWVKPRQYNNIKLRIINEGTSNKVNLSNINQISDTCKGVTVKGERCKLEPVDNYTSYIKNLLCLKSPKDMCYLHCDCDNCSNRQRTVMQGIYYTDTTAINKKIKVIKKKASDYQKNYQPPANDNNITRTTPPKIPVFLQKENDIEKLKKVIYVLYANHKATFDLVIDTIKEDNNKILKESKELRAKAEELIAKADMLEEGLK